MGFIAGVNHGARAGSGVSHLIPHLVGALRQAIAAIISQPAGPTDQLAGNQEGQQATGLAPIVIAARQQIVFVATITMTGLVAVIFNDVQFLALQALISLPNQRLHQLVTVALLDKQIL